MKLLRWLTLLAYMGFIFYLSSRTWEGIIEAPVGFDKSVHAFLYFGLGGIALWTFRTTRLRDNSRIILFSVIFSILYGLSDEIHQLYVPGRECSFFDLLADAAGSWAGVFAISRFKRGNYDYHHT